MIIIGDDTPNILPGTGGPDTILGLGAGDVLSGLAGIDTLAGGDGVDFCFGGTGDDGIAGEDGNDSLRGEDGNDLLSGDLGRDIIIGGAGNDRFQFTNGDSLVGRFNRDYVLDFTQGSDKLQINLGGGPFSWSTTAAGPSGISAVNTLMRLDFGNDGTIDGEILFKGAIAFTNSDFQFV
jgi:Ca2+-binding RTX toxin-like protein